MATPEQKSRRESDTLLSKVLCDVGYALVSADDWQERVAFVLDQLALMVPVELAVVLLADHEKALLLRLSSPDSGALVDDAKRNVLEHYHLLTGTRLSADEIRGYHLKTAQDLPAFGSARPEGVPEPGSSSYLSLPLLGMDQIVGVIHLSSTKPHSYGVRELSILSVIATQLGGYLSHLSYRRMVEQYDRERDSAIAEMVHELRNPLASASGFTQLVLRQMKKTGKERSREIEGLARAEEQLRHLTELTSGVLDVARVRAGWVAVEKEMVDLAALARRVGEAVQVTTTSHTITVAADGNCLILGDQVRLEQVVQNLLSNAVKYSPEGGNVDVNVVRKDGQVILSVADHGIGIAREQQEQLFQRYYRADTETRRRVGGTGLGLFISNEIMRRHGSRLEVESEVGKGSVFFFRLPAAES